MPPTLPRVSSARGLALAILALLLCGGALRWIVAGRSAPVKPMGDEIYYAITAVRIAEGKGHSYAPGWRAAWPPGHPFLLSHFVPSDVATPDARNPDLVRPLTRLQVALGTILVALTAALGAALFDARTGVLAGALAAAYPTFVALSHTLWSETLFAVLLTAALIGVARGARRPGGATTALTGLAFGLATLTREIALPLACACSLWWVGRAEPGERRATAGRAALLLLCTALVVAPWTHRNHRVLGRFVPVSTAGWMGLYEGNVLGESWFRPDFGALWDFRNRYTSIADEVERMDVTRREALQLIRDEQPTWLAKKLVRNVALLFGADSPLFVKLRRGTYPEPSRSTVRWLLVVTIGCYVLVVTAGVLGMAASPGPGSLGALAFGTLIAIHVVANANSRYRIPLMPLLMVYASHALLARATLRERLRGRRRVAAIAALLIFFALCVPYFGPQAAELWCRGVE